MALLCEKKPFKQFYDRPSDRRTDGQTKKWLTESRSTRLKAHRDMATLTGHANRLGKRKFGTSRHPGDLQV